MINKHKILYRVGLIFLLIVMIFCVAFLSFIKYCNKFEKGLEYISQFEHSGKIAFVNDSVFCFENQTVKYREEDIGGYEVNDILYVTNDKIYFTSPKGNFKNIYVCNHSFEEITFIHSINGGYAVMYSDNEIRCTEDAGKTKYIYNLDDNSIKEVEEFPELELAEKKYEAKINSSFLKQSSVEIQDKATQEVKMVSRSQILESSQSKELKDIFGFNSLAFNRVIEHNGEIYIVCMSNLFIAMVYTYDFKTEQIEFFDWTETAGTLRMYFMD